jgi:hypothetical protein
VITFKILTETLKDIKELGNDALDTAKQSSTNLLYFVLIFMFLTLGGALGFAAYSKLDPFINLIIISILLSIFVLVGLVSFFSMIRNPTKFIFNQNAFITVMREGLNDSRNPKTIYYTDTLAQLNSVPPLELKEQEQKEKNK